MLRRRNSSAFLLLVAYGPAYLIVQFHLGQICLHQRIQHGKHHTIVNIFPNIQGFHPPFS
jgi:hypothetical protein